MPLVSDDAIDGGIASAVAALLRGDLTSRPLGRTRHKSAVFNSPEADAQRWPFGKIDGPGKPHPNQGPLFLKQPNQKGHPCGCLRCPSRELIAEHRAMVY